MRTVIGFLGETLLVEVILKLQEFTKMLEIFGYFQIRRVGRIQEKKKSSGPEATM